jgi:hypothetical protein
MEIVFAEMLISVKKMQKVAADKKELVIWSLSL